jgi:transposase
MAWSPPAHNAGIVWVSAPGDYATFNSNHTPDGTAPTCVKLSPNSASGPSRSSNARLTLPGFQPLPRRWVVERTLAWLNRNRRLAKDFEASIASAKAWVYIASVQLLISLTITQLYTIYYNLTD